MSSRFQNNAQSLGLRSSGTNPSNPAFSRPELAPAQRFGVGQYEARPYRDEATNEWRTGRTQEDMIKSAYLMGFRPQKQALDARYGVENLDFYDVFDQNENAQVLISRIQQRASWIGVAMPMKVAQTLTIGMDYLIFRDTAPDVLPEEAVPSLMTAERRSWSDTLGRYGKGIRMERTFFHTPFGRAYYYWQLEQIINAILMAMMHSALCALYYDERAAMQARPQRARKEFLTTGRAQSVASALQSSFKSFAFVNKDPKRIPAVMRQALAEFSEQSNGLAPNRAVWPDGCSTFFEEALAQQAPYWETGFKMGQMPQLRQMIDKGMAYCESFSSRMGDGRLDHDPAYRNMSGGGYVTCSSENYLNSVDHYQTKHLDFDLFNEDSDQIQRFPFEPVIGKTGVWLNYDVCDSADEDERQKSQLSAIGRAFFGRVRTYKDAYNQDSPTRGLADLLKVLRNKPDFWRDVRHLTERPAPPQARTAARASGSAEDALAAESAYQDTVTGNELSRDWSEQLGPFVARHDPEHRWSHAKLRQVLAQLGAVAPDDLPAFLTAWGAWLTASAEQTVPADAFDVAFAVLDRMTLNRAVAGLVGTTTQPLTRVEQWLRARLAGDASDPYADPDAQAELFAVQRDDVSWTLDNEAERGEPARVWLPFQAWSVSPRGRVFSMASVRLVLVSLSAAAVVRLLRDDWETRVLSRPAQGSAFLASATRLAHFFRTLRFSMIVSLLEGDEPGTLEALRALQRAPRKPSADLDDAQWGFALEEAERLPLLFEDWRPLVEATRPGAMAAALGAGALPVWRELWRGIKDRWLTTAPRAASRTSGRGRDSDVRLAQLPEAQRATAMAQWTKLCAATAKLDTVDKFIGKWQAAHPLAAGGRWGLTAQLKSASGWAAVTEYPLAWSAVLRAAAGQAADPMSVEFVAQLATHLEFVRASTAVYYSAAVTGPSFTDSDRAAVANASVVQRLSGENMARYYLNTVAHALLDGVEVAKMTEAVKADFASWKVENEFAAGLSYLMSLALRTEIRYVQQLLSSLLVVRVTDDQRVVVPEPLRGAWQAAKLLEAAMLFNAESGKTEAEVRAATLRLLMGFAAAPAGLLKALTPDEIWRAVSRSAAFQEQVGRRPPAAVFTATTWAVAEALCRRLTRRGTDDKDYPGFATTPLVADRAGLRGIIPLRMANIKSTDVSAAATKLLDETTAVGKAFEAFVALLGAGGPAPEGELTLWSLGEVLDGWDIEDARYFKLMLRHDVPVFMGYVGFRPEPTYDMGSLVLLIDGLSGNLYYIPPEMSLGEDPKDMMIAGSVALYYKGMLNGGETVLRVPDVFCRAYVGGNGVEVWDPLNEEDIDAYTGTANRIQFHKHMFVVPEWMHKDHSAITYRDITGQFPEALDGNAKEKDACAYSTAAVLCETWKWTNEYAAGPDNYETASRRLPRHNTIVCQDWQRMYDGNGGYTRVKSNKGVWSNSAIYDGCSADRSGGVLKSMNYTVVPVTTS